MISLIHYNEFGPGMGFPSLKDSFYESEYEGQSKIVDYLKSGQTHMVGMGKTYDVLTGEEIEHEILFMDDGKYSWISTLIYYVEKYNLRLPHEFEEYVLAQ